MKNIKKAIGCLLLLLFVAAYQTSVFAQITVSVKNTKIRQIIQQLEKSSGYSFFYSDDYIDLDKIISVDIKNENIESALNRIFKDTNIKYAVGENKQVILADGKQNNERVRPLVMSQKKITGIIKDEKGEPVIGASVTVKGTTTGTISDIDGSFSLDVPQNATLIISYLGFLPEEIKVGDKTVLDIILEENTQTLDEIVVVGYGVQKKINLSGAVQAVGAEALASRPISNVGSGLQGMVPNLNITVNSGRADDAPILNIRGFTSINDTNGEAFVLVDNMPVTREELARLNPDDIANVSVLKDASAAAIYGARAAFGVVLITTRSAQDGKLQINFSGNYALRDRGIAPGIETDVETVMNMKSAARYPLSAIFSPQQLEYAKQITANPGIDRTIVDPTNPNVWQYYGQTDWFDETHKNTAATYTANLNISKKTDNLSYYVSGGYYKQDGLLKYGNDILNRYNIRSKADVKLTNWWNLGANLTYTHINYDSPSFLDGYFYWQVNRTSSLDVPKNPDGTWTTAGATLLGVLNEGGRRKDRTNETQVSITTQFDIVKDIWKVNADINFRRTNKTRDKENLAVKYRTGPNQPILQTFGERGGSGNNSVNNIAYYSWEDMYSVYNIYTNFTKTFAGKHYFNSMLGYNREFQTRYYYSTVKTGLITPALPEINLSTGDVTATNTRRELALEGIFGRLNYIYDNRYIFEMNGRYDGSSRFLKGDRYGFFPSASVAWSVINEPFFRAPAEKLHMTNLKFRGSYGALGNQALADYYPAIPYMTGSKMSYILDGAQPIMMGQPGVVSPTLTWEKVRTVNFGVDLGLFNKFDLNFDVYSRYTDDMLTQSKELPAVFGATPPKTNAADLKTNGWELSLAYRDKFTVKGSPLNWSVKFMISDSQSKITKYDNPTYNFGKDGNSYYEGKKIGEIWGFTTDGYFKTQEEADALNQREIGTDDVGYVFQVGDIKMKDLDGDKKISFGDNTLEKPGDRKVIGNTSARYPYSFELSADWKGFDIRAFFQGVGKRDWYPGAASIYFWGVYAQPWTNVTTKNMDHWTEDNPNAYFPRVKAYAAEDGNMELAAAQTKYLQDASYLRLKNLTIGYSIPKNILKSLNISYLRFYFSAENLFTVSHLDKGIDLDPEIIDRYNGFNSGTYPMQRIYSIGANLTF
ncbi:MAG: TonB-dependent receptor [Prevotella sp.]|jgi:TonB-linked SusC/RagA family outer membrane protein|nr:TonB-dependent receptor [Prevotella sp.]